MFQVGAHFFDHRHDIDWAELAGPKESNPIKARSGLWRDIFSRHRATAHWIGIPEIAASTPARPFSGRARSQISALLRAFRDPAEGMRRREDSLAVAPVCCERLSHDPYFQTVVEVGVNQPTG